MVVCRDASVIHVVLQVAEHRYDSYAVLDVQRNTLDAFDLPCVETVKALLDNLEE